MHRRTLLVPVAFPLYDGHPVIVGVAPCRLHDPRAARRALLNARNGAPWATLGLYSPRPAGWRKRTHLVPIDMIELLEDYPDA